MKFGLKLMPFPKITHTFTNQLTFFKTFGVISDRIYFESVMPDVRDVAKEKKMLNIRRRNV